MIDKGATSAVNSRADDYIRPYTLMAKHATQKSLSNWTNQQVERRMGAQN